MKNKNIKQIIPFAIMLLLLTAGYALASSVPATGAGKGSFRQTSIGEAFPSPVAYTAEDEAMICSDAFITCKGEDKNGNSVAAIRVTSESSPFQATISFYDELSSCHYPAKGGCLTASGKIAKYGMVATNLYPFGTKIKIEGLGVFTVEDRISKRYNNRIDVWVGYGKEANVKAKQMGLQNKRIEIL